MQGCNGSLDGDGAAAMRYTESRLTQYAEMMVEGIKKNTVPLIPNYDGGEVEPAVLPSLLPNLLINGASGIAAGYATNIPPFNPNEVFDAVIARIDSPNCHLETIKNLMPGPDFPTGGFIHNLQGIDDAYATGKGKIVIRAKIDLVGKKQAFITQIPFEVNKAHLIDEIQDLAEQHESLNIIDCHDESDENGVSICINLKSTDNFDFVKNFLFKNTQAQVSYAINLTAIKDHKPYTMSILFILDAFIEHITEVTINAAKFDLAKAKLRKEVIEGLIKAISIIDEVVALIRRSTDKVSAKQALITKLLFTEVQAEAIVTLRLYRLTNSDVTELQEELKQIIEAIREFELIANDKTYRNNYIKNKLRSSKKLFNTPRKSVFSNEDATTVIDQNDIIEDRDNYLIITKDGYLKNVPTKSVVLSSPEELKIKEGDIPVAQFKSNQRHKLILITSKGNYVSIPVYKIETTR
jgi:topoisomerase-4 subunit A